MGLSFLVLFSEFHFSLEEIFFGFGWFGVGWVVWPWGWGGGSARSPPAPLPRISTSLSRPLMHLFVGAWAIPYHGLSVLEGCYPPPPHFEQRHLPHKFHAAFGLRLLRRRQNFLELQLGCSGNVMFGCSCIAPPPPGGGSFGDGPSQGWGGGALRVRGGQSRGGWGGKDFRRSPSPTLKLGNASHTASQVAHGALLQDLHTLPPHTEGLG